MCYKPLAVLAIQRDNSEELIGTHQSQSGCNSTGVSSSRLLFKLLNNDDNIVLGFARGLLPFEGHIHKAGELRQQASGRGGRCGSGPPSPSSPSAGAGRAPGAGGERLVANRIRRFSVTFSALSTSRESAIRRGKRRPRLG